MRVEYEFEWDEEKNYGNQRKHGISFETAAKVFFDPKHIIKYDWEHSINEERWKAIGRINWVVLIVHYTVRNGRTRIFSARKAEREDKEDYENGYGTT